MAQVAPRPESESVTSWFLEYLHGFWTSFPEFADEWTDWDDFSQHMFVIEWPLMREKVRHVRMAEAAGSLTPGQLALWHEIQRLTETHRMEMEAMLGHPL